MPLLFIYRHIDDIIGDKYDFFEIRLDMHKVTSVEGSRSSGEKGFVCEAIG